MKRKHSLTKVLLALFLPYLSFGIAQSCSLERGIVFASLDWPSAQLHNAIARYVMKVGFGCTSSEISGSAMPLLQELSQGNIDIIMEVWMDNVPKAFFESLQKGAIIQLATIMEGVEGFFVPRYMIEGDSSRGIQASAPDLQDVADLPLYASLFSSSGTAQKGVFYNCVMGWKCEKINDYKLEAYGLNDYFINYKLDSGLALENVIKAAYEAGKPFLTYYWGPTWIMGEYEMVQLREPVYEELSWQAMKDSIETSNKLITKQAVAYPKKKVSIVISKEMLAVFPPDLLGFLAAYRIEEPLVSHYLAIMQKEKLSSEELAQRFLREQEALWSPWLPEELVLKIKASYR